MFQMISPPFLMCNITSCSSSYQSLEFHPQIVEFYEAVLPKLQSLLTGGKSLVVKLVRRCPVARWHNYYNCAGLFIMLFLSISSSQAKLFSNMYSSMFLQVKRMTGAFYPPWTLPGLNSTTVRMLQKEEVCKFSAIKSKQNKRLKTWMKLRSILTPN